MNDLERARTVPCPGCKRPADSACVDLETGREAAGVHQVRIYRAYVVAEADAHNRAAEMTELSGLLAGALDNAMQRLHGTHETGTRWITCRASTLCQDVAALFERDDVQAALAAVRARRGEDPATGEPA